MSAVDSAAVAAQQSTIRHLIAQNLYDTKIVAQLEENVKFQIKSGSYDAEANRELLKLYAVAPDMIRLDILSRLLLKCVMQLPSPDFVTSMYLLPEKLHALEPIKALLRFHNLLDTCAFKRFWMEMDAWRANGANQAVLNFAEVSDFDANIRRFINITLSATYSTITVATLKEMWNLSDKAAFESLVSSLGWTLTEEGKTVVIKATAANSDAAPVQRTELPPMEALAKLITAA